jgi:hypothetical protein
VSPRKKFEVNFPEYYVSSNINNSGKKLLEGYKNDAHYFIEEDSFEAKYFHHALYKNYKLIEASGGFKSRNYKTYEPNVILDPTSNKNLHLKTIVKDGSYYLLDYIGTNEADKTAFFQSFKFNKTDYKNFEKVKDFEENTKQTIYSTSANEQISVSRQKFHDLQIYHNVDSLWQNLEDKINYSNRYYSPN